MSYDYTLQKNDIDYGFVRGDNKVVFIKPGLGGNYLGHENKYLIMARQLREKYGCSVIVSSNPHDGKGHSDDDKHIIEQYISNGNMESPKLFFFGHSNGGIKGLELTSVNVEFEKMMIVNMPLMINFHKTKRYISAIPQTEIIAIYGERDPSFPYVPFLRGKAENVKVITFPRADHQFKGMLNEFIDLSDLLMN